MTDIVLTQSTSVPIALRGEDNGLIAPSATLAAPTAAVTMTSTPQYAPTLAVLGTVWAGGQSPAVLAEGRAMLSVGEAGAILSARSDGLFSTTPGDDYPARLRVDNAGLISGRDDGIDGDRSSLMVTNTGTIRGLDGSGIEAAGGAQYITNHGLIGGTRGIESDSGFTRIVNHGRIEGETFAIVARGADALVVNRGDLVGFVSLETERGRFDGRGGGAAEVAGGAGQHVLTGGAMDDRLFGGAGDDTLRGGAGDDWLEGNEDADLIFGGEGADSLSGGAGNDDLRGGAGDDSLTGDDGGDRLAGGNGEDDLFGWTGDDTLDGGAGDDLIDGGAGADTLLFRTAAAVTVDLRRSDMQDTGQGHDTILRIEHVTSGSGDDVLTGNAAANRLLSGAGHDRLFGEAGADVLNGGAGNDVLAGGDGNDRLVGGTENDRLLGGAGRDTFVFGKGDGRDVIEDFQNGLDRIDLHGLDIRLADLGIAPTAGGVVLAAGDLRITLAGIEAASIDASDFLF